MSCDPIREQLFTLDADQLEGLAHLSDCDACRSLAERIVAAEQGLDAHVVAHAEGGDFDAAWGRSASAVPRDPEPPVASRLSWIHGVGIALAAAAALAVVLWPPAEPPAAPVAPTEPGPVEAPAAPPVDSADPEVWDDGEDHIGVLVGHSVLLEVPKVPDEVYAADPDVIEVELLREKVIALHGHTPGETTFHVVYPDPHKPSEYLVRVRPAADGGSEADYALSVGGMAEVTFERTPAVVTVGDPELVDARLSGHTLRMTAVAQGSTSVSILFEEPGPPEIFLVRIAP